MGYPTRIILDPSTQNIERFQCSVCSDLLDNPHQDQCGHRLCLECFQKRGDPGTQRCRMCGEEGNLEEPYNPDFTPNPDFAIKREMMKLRVGCMNEDCPWEDCLKILPSHMEHCQFKPIVPSSSPCPVCHNETSIEDHADKFSNITGELKKITDTMAVQNDILMVMHMQYNGIFQKLKDIPTIASLKDQVDELKEELVKSQAFNLDLERSLNLQKLTTYDGTLLWTITDFAGKLRLADTSQCTSFFSPFFYTDRYGFKMCVRLYLNGDGAARNTHISIFFVLAKGDNDSLLKWPFNHSVSFSLLDQSLLKDHVIFNFKPDLESSSFHKPTTELNLPSGFPKFLLQKEFKENYDRFVVNDTAFIKVVVNLAKTT